MCIRDSRKIAVNSHTEIQKPRYLKILNFTCEISKKLICMDDCYDIRRRKWMWDDELTKKSTKILLLVNNCTAHKDTKALKQIKIVFYL